MLFVFCPRKCGSAILPCVSAQGHSAVLPVPRECLLLEKAHLGYWLLSCWSFLGSYIRSVSGRIPGGKEGTHWLGACVVSPGFLEL